MGAQQSTVGRTKSLDEWTNNGATSSSSSSAVTTDAPEFRSYDPYRRFDRDKRSKSTLVIVNRPSMDSFASIRIEDDPLFKKLNELPMFVPLMHEIKTGSNLFGAKTRALAEIRSKIEPSPFINIVRLYEERLKRHADAVNIEQGQLSKCAREIDMGVASIFKNLTDRQKKFAKHAENLGKMNDLTHSLQKCQSMLKNCERNLQILNGLLSLEDRLEPFSWTELFDHDENLESESNLESSGSVEIAVEGIS